MIPSTGKSFYLYDSILKDVNKIFVDNDINLKKIPNRIIIDFEKSLQKAIKLNYPNSVIDGCFFHFVKLLWGRAKQLGLYKKSEMKNTKLVLFILKIIPFLKSEDKNEVFNKLEDLFDNKENNFSKLISYYKKNWLFNSYINYEDLSQEEYLNRTNNFLESFHGHLNQMLQCYHPKITYLISKYKIYLINIYDKIKSNLFNKNNILFTKKFSVVDDILLFIKNYNDKYHTKINTNLIIQSDENNMKIINKICIYLLDIFFDIYYEEDNNQELDNDDLDDEIVSDSINEDLNLDKEEDKGQFIF